MEGVKRRGGASDASHFSTGGGLSAKAGLKQGVGGARWSRRGEMVEVRVHQ